MVVTKAVLEAEVGVARLVYVPVFPEASGALVAIGVVQPEVARRREVSGHCSNHHFRNLEPVARPGGGTLRHMDPGEGPYGLGWIWVPHGSLDMEVVQVRSEFQASGCKAEFENSFG